MFIIDETPFFHPDYLNRVINNFKKDKIFVGITKKIPKKNNLNFQLLKKFYLLNLKEIFFLLYKKVSFYLLDLIFPKGLKQKNFSVEGVCKKKDIKYFFIEKNINQKQYLKKIKYFKPKIIISSNSLYFSENLLKINSIFINRHSSLLPKYKGLFPVMHAIINEEKFVGVTLHLMNKNYDSGKILLQKKILLNKDKNLTKVYQACFKVSEQLTTKIIKNIKNNKFNFKKNKQYKKIYSYFSFPNNKELKKFKRLGWRLI
jgi:methionyl-tRNA formyltransferase